MNSPPDLHGSSSGAQAKEPTAAAPAPKSSSTMRGTAVVGGITLLSRILGFVRDSLVARLFGSSPIADAFFVAFRIPNLLRSFVAEGAMTSAFVPVLASELAKSKDAARAAMRSGTRWACSPGWRWAAPSGWC